MPAGVAFPCPTCSTLPLSPSFVSYFPTEVNFRRGKKRTLKAPLSRSAKSVTKFRNSSEGRKILRVECFRRSQLFGSLPLDSELWTINRSIGAIEIAYNALVWLLMHYVTFEHDHGCVFVFMNTGRDRIDRETITGITPRADATR